MADGLGRLARPSAIGIRRSALGYRERTTNLLLRIKPIRQATV